MDNRDPNKQVTVKTSTDNLLLEVMEKVKEKENIDVGSRNKVIRMLATRYLADAR